MERACIQPKYKRIYIGVTERSEGTYRERLKTGEIFTYIGLYIVFVFFQDKVLKCCNNYRSAFIHINAFMSALDNYTYELKCISTNLLFSNLSRK